MRLLAGIPMVMLVCACEPQPVAQGCTPGRQEACACLGGNTGVQTCNDEGTRFRTCECPGGSSGGPVFSSSSADRPSSGQRTSSSAVEACSHGTLPASGNPAEVTTCTCLIAGDSCLPDEPRCARTGATCSVIELCPDGYACEDARCVCADPVRCGLKCDDDGDCRASVSGSSGGAISTMGTSVCNRRVGACQPAPVCLSDAMCPSGQICENVFHRWECFAPGAGATGDPCMSPTECASGICSTRSSNQVGICLQACRANSGCPSGQVCTGDVYEGTELACRAVVECVDACDQPADLCFRRRCATRPCDTSVDCGGGTCSQVNGRDPEIPVRVCVATTQCQGDEFLAGDANTDPFCILRQHCWVDEECACPYRCVRRDEIAHGTGDEGFTGYCGRAVAPER